MAVKFCIVFLGLMSTVQATTAFVADTGMERFFRQDYEFDLDQSSFYKLHTETSTWIQALSICEAEGAKLAMPENSAEAEVMVRIMRAQLHPDLTGVFVGIHNMFMDGTFITVEGTDVKNVLSDWGINMLNDTDYEFKGNSCGLLLREGILDQGFCYMEQAFICKKTLDINPCGTADTDYFVDETNTKCYKLHHQQMNWTDAYATCFKERAYLAIVNSEYESWILHHKMGSLKKLSYQTLGLYKNNGNDLPKNVWLGFHNKFSNEFTTVKGYPVSESGYFEWESDPSINYVNDVEPSSITSSKCGMMHYERQLTSKPCHVLAPFFCERDLYTRVSGRGLSSYGKMLRIPSPIYYA